jgi:hypothetical protein
LAEKTLLLTEYLENITIGRDLATITIGRANIVIGRVFGKHYYWQSILNKAFVTILEFSVMEFVGIDVMTCAYICQTPQMVHTTNGASPNFLRILMPICYHHE